MSDIAMPTARNKNPDGSIELVQTPGTPYRPGHHYFNGSYHNNLFCLHCDARVHFNRGAESLVGTFRGREAHFKTNPGQRHENCLWGLRDPEQREQDIDKEKGYRIHINTLRHSDAFNRASGVYRRDREGRVYAYDPSLQKRESISIRGAQDLVTLMLKGEFKRLTDSVVIFNNRAIRWNEFALYLAKPERYVALVDRLRAGGKNMLHPVFMEINVEKPPHAGMFKTSFLFKTPRISTGRTDTRHLPEYIIPSFKVIHDHDTILESVFPTPGRYMILGIPRLNSREYDHVTNHYLDFKITDLRQVYFGNILEIAQTAKRNAEKRASQAQVEPSSP